MRICPFLSCTLNFLSSHFSEGWLNTHLHPWICLYLFLAFTNKNRLFRTWMKGDFIWMCSLEQIYVILRSVFNNMDNKYITANYANKWSHPPFCERLEMKTGWRQQINVHYLCFGMLMVCTQKRGTFDRQQYNAKVIYFSLKLG